MIYHQPVLLKESIEALAIEPDGKYADLTFGGGGHSREIIKKLSAKGHLYGFDQDEAAIEHRIEAENFTISKCNYRYFTHFLKYYNEAELDGILMDLGVSSHQFDQSDRGFAFRLGGELDMRMNDQQDMTAAEILNNYSVNDLVRVFSEYGEVRNSKSLSRAIIEKRKNSKFDTIEAFVGFLDQWKLGNRQKYMSQVFQALRIEVNDEIDSLKEALMGARSVLKKKGRLVVISYHSIEDRMVKYYMKFGNFDGEIDKDPFGNVVKPFQMIHKKVIQPKEDEIKENPRARSAKMRIAERL